MEGISSAAVEKYAGLYEKDGYHLASSASVYVPLFQCTLKCQCMAKHPMSELDMFFCKCIERGIDTEADIAFVLALSYQIVEGGIEELIQNGIISKREDKLFFTEDGKRLYRQNSKIEKITREFNVNMNGITGEWSLIEIEEVIDSEVAVSGIRLQPIKTIVQLDIENNEEIIQALQCKYDVQVLSMSLLDYQNIHYQEETIIFYKNDERRILFSLYDNKTQELDILLADALLKRYERRELLDIMQAESYIQGIEEKFIHNDKLLSKYDVFKETKHTYYRNQEIRELFKRVFDIAEKSVFLVSPWIDNNNYVMTEEILSKMEYALKEKGIKISIGYGYISEEKMKKKRMQYTSSTIKGNPERDKDWQTELMAQKLKQRLGKYDKFSIFYVGTHEKVLSYDDRYTLVGSYNLLSYDGGESEDYKGLHFRFEGGVMIDDSEFAQYVQNEIMSNGKV